MLKKIYHYVEPEETLEEMIKILAEGLERELTDQEVRMIHWLSDCEFETRGILLDIFKELVERQGTK